MLDLKEFQKAVYQNAVDHGFWKEEERLPDHYVIATKLALIHSEVSEALEEVRIPQPILYYEGQKPCGFGSELADVIIRTLDLAQRYDLDMEKILKEKHEYNKTRKHMHGGKKL